MRARIQLVSVSLIMVSFIILTLSACALQAQENRGAIAGKVADATGAPIPRVEVVATNLETNTKVSGITNQDGTYLIPYLLPGSYSIAAQSPGFKTFVRSGVVVRIDDRLQIDISMEVGEVTERVTVTAETPLLETTNASLGQVIERKWLSDLPVTNSNAMLLLQMTPGVVSNAINMSFTDTRSTDNARLTEYSIAGAPASTHEVTLDGASNTTTWGGTAANQRTIAFTPPSDIIEEFKVDTAGYDARVGNTPGGVIAISLKSGTNSLHGAARYFRTNTGWNANDFFANKFGQPRSYLSSNHTILSGTGPIVLPKIYDGRNRTFFTYAWDYENDKVPFANQNYTVPTAAERQGDFSALLKLGPNYQIYNPYSATLVNGHVVRQPFQGNIIPSNLFSPGAQKILQYYPAPLVPGLADGTNNYPQPNLLLTTKITSHTGRIDHHISERNRIFLHGYWGERPQSGRDYFHNLSTGVTSPGFENRGAALDDVYTLSPNIVLDIRYSYTRFIYNSTAKSLGMDLTTLGFPASLVQQISLEGTAFPLIGVNGLSNLGIEKPTYRSSNTHQLAANVGWVRGKHIFNFGADARDYQENFHSYGNAAPTLSFGSAWTQAADNSSSSPGGVGQGFASFLLGLPTSGAIDNNASYAVASPLVGLFLQDDWRLTSRFTLNLGLRYEVEGALTERYNRSVSGFDTTTVSPLNAQVSANYALNPLPQVPVSQFVVKGGPLFAGVGGQSSSLFSTPKLNFAPRIGFAYQFGKNTVIRAGYGIFRGFVGLQAGNKVYQAGFSQSTALTPSLDGGLTFVATVDNPFPGGLLQPAGARNGLNTYLGNSITYYNQHPLTPYNQRWSLDIQRTLPKQFLLDLAYVGNRGVHLQTNHDLTPFNPQYLSRSPVRDQANFNFLTTQVANPFYPLFPGTGLASATISRSQLLQLAQSPSPQFTDVNTTDNAGFSWYHGLEARLQKRFATGFTMQASYTFSKMMQALTRLNGQLSPLEHVIALGDRPHSFSFGGIYELPFGQGKAFQVPNRFLRSVVGDWQADAVILMVSGPPLGFGNALLTGSVNDIALARDQRTTDRWFNTSVFNTNVSQQLVSNYITLSSAFTGVRAPGRDIWNASLIKSIRIHERLNLQLRGEAYNVLNHPNFGAPNTSPTNASFGRVTTTTTNGRLIELGAKLVW